jgi:hypothetical protein
MQKQVLTSHISHIFSHTIEFVFIWNLVEQNKNYEKYLFNLLLQLHYGRFHRHQ